MLDHPVIYGRRFIPSPKYFTVLKHPRRPKTGSLEKRRGKAKRSHVAAAKSGFIVSPPTRFGRDPHLNEMLRLKSFRRCDRQPEGSIMAA